MNYIRKRLIFSASNTPENDTAPVSESASLLPDPDAERTTVTRRSSFLWYNRFRCRLVVVLFLLYGIFAILEFYAAAGYVFETVGMGILHIQFGSCCYFFYFYASVCFIMAEFAGHCLHFSEIFKGQPVSRNDKDTFQSWRTLVLVHLLINVAVLFGPVYFDFTSHGKFWKHCDINWKKCFFPLFLLSSFLLCRIFSIGVLSLYLKEIRKDEPNKFKINRPAARQFFLEGNPNLPYKIF